jgi:protein ImuA
VKAAAHLALWRADQIDRRTGPDDVRSTGHAALDVELPGGGWPATGLTELLLAAPGCGELRLLAPALAALAPAPLLWVAPPFTPYAPALAALGLAADRLTLAAPATGADAAWAAEQALRSGALAAVLWWEGGAHITPTTLRRLHLAATDGRTPLFALRPAAARAQSSPAPLRLTLEPMSVQQLLLVDVFKRRGPPMTTPLRLTLEPMSVQQLLLVDVFKRRGPPMTTPLRVALPAVVPARRRALRRPAVPPAGLPEPSNAVVRAAPERVAA